MRGGRSRLAAARRRRQAIGRRRKFVRKVLGSKVHKFNEMCQITSIGAGGAATAAGRISFKFTDLTNAANYVQLFDLYKLTGVKLKLVPRYNVAQVGANGGGAVDQLPMLYIAPNHDQFVPPPASIADVLNDDGVKVIRGGQVINLWIKNPKVDLRAYSQDGLTNFFVPLQFNSSSKALQPWLLTGGNGQLQNQSGLDHYGFRWFVDNSASADGVKWEVYATYYFSMKEQD